jgi:hypothetical protein
VRHTRSPQRSHLSPFNIKEDNNVEMASSKVLIGLGKSMPGWQRLRGTHAPPFALCRRRRAPVAFRFGAKKAKASANHATLNPPTTGLVPGDNDEPPVLLQLPNPATGAPQQFVLLPPANGDGDGDNGGDAAAAAAAAAAPRLLELNCVRHEFGAWLVGDKMLAGMREGERGRGRGLFGARKRWWWWCLHVEQLSACAGVC